MNVQQTTLSALTIGVVYDVKFAMLQRVAIYITVTGIVSNIATVEYRALSDDISPYATKTFPDTTTVFIVS